MWRLQLNKWRKSIIMFSFIYWVKWSKIKMWLSGKVCEPLLSVTGEASLSSIHLNQTFLVTGVQLQFGQFWAILPYSPASTLWCWWVSLHSLFFCWVFLVLLEHFYCVMVWTLTWPFYNVKYILFYPCLCRLTCVLVVIVFLDDLFTVKVQVTDRYPNILL